MAYFTGEGVLCALDTYTLVESAYLHLPPSTAVSNQPDYRTK
jgi:hypothetical protein